MPKQLLWAVVVVCAVPSVLLWQALTAREHAQIQFAVEQETLTLRTEIIERIEPKILALERMAMRWEIRGGTPREEWEADGARYIADQTGKQALDRFRVGVSHITPSSGHGFNRATTRITTAASAAEGGVKSLEHTEFETHLRR